MKFDISSLLIKPKEVDSKIDTNEDKTLENLEVINKNKRGLYLNTIKLNSHDSLINENKNKIDKYNAELQWTAE